MFKLLSYLEFRDLFDFLLLFIILPWFNLSINIPRMIQKLAPLFGERQEKIIIQVLVFVVVDQQSIEELEGVEGSVQIVHGNQDKS